MRSFPVMGPTVLFAIIILLPLTAAVSGYVLLRQRDRQPLAAGCAAIAIGVLLSFAISALFYLLGWA